MANDEIGKIIGNIKKAWNPELDIPVDEQENPVNYRIVRLRALTHDLIAKQKDLSLELEKLEGNLSALLQEINDQSDNHKG